MGSLQGVPNWTLICINVGVKWGVCIEVVVVSSKINIQILLRLSVN